MTVSECYARVKGDYLEALGRFKSDSMIAKFIMLYTRDTSLDDLKTAFYAQDYEKAFAAAHTLKGVLRNMAFNDYAMTVSEITEYLRDGKNISAAIEIFPIVVSKAQDTLDVVDAFVKEREG